MSNYIPYGKQDINQEDIQAVVDVLKSDFITQGPKAPAFEKSLCEYTGAKHAVAVNSATSALHIACLSLGVGEGDSVWTSPITFVASANCALYCGAKVDFVDIDPKTYNMSVFELEKKLRKAKKTNTLPKVVIPVHLAGASCEMEAIWKLSKEYGFSIIEDASHAIGGKYQNVPVGSCKYSDICVFSFHPVKIITTAEGGAAMTNDPELAMKMESLRSHGITRDRELLSRDDGPWYYEQQSLGLNYRMTEMQAALGVQQMKRLDQFVSRRHELVKNYQELLSNSSLTLPFVNEDTYSSYHLYIVQTSKRDQIFKKMREAGVGVNVHYIPVHLQPYYQNLGFKRGDFPASESYYQQAMSLPLFPDLTHNQQEHVASTLKNALD